MNYEQDHCDADVGISVLCWKGLDCCFLSMVNKILRCSTLYTGSLFIVNYSSSVTVNPSCEFLTPCSISGFSRQIKNYVCLEAPVFSFNYSIILSHAVIANRSSKTIPHKYTNSISGFILSDNSPFVADESSF